MDARSSLLMFLKDLRSSKFCGKFQKGLFHYREQIIKRVRIRLLTLTQLRHSISISTSPLLGNSDNSQVTSRLEIKSLPRPMNVFLTLLKRFKRYHLRHSETFSLQEIKQPSLNSLKSPILWLERKDSISQTCIG